MLIQQNVQLIIRAANGIPAVNNVKKVCQFTRRSIYFKVKVTPIVCVATLSSRVQFTRTSYEMFDTEKLVEVYVTYIMTEH